MQRGSTNSLKEKEPQQKIKVTGKGASCASNSKQYQGRDKNCLSANAANTPRTGLNTRDGKEKTDINKPIFCGGTCNAWIIFGKAGGTLASTIKVIRETV